MLSDKELEKSRAGNSLITIRYNPPSRTGESARRGLYDGVVESYNDCNIVLGNGTKQGCTSLLREFCYKPNGNGKKKN